jgi:broad specificity polyphosphatase/5'/3'-nucleotidase SurE
MIYLLVSRSRQTDGSKEIEAGTPLNINIPSRDIENQPIIGFVSIALAEKYLERKNISRDEYRFILKDRGQSDDYHDQPIFLVENEAQVKEMESNSEQYDYESHIFKNAS